MEDPAILTDEQIDDLLNQAEARLRAKAEGTNSEEILFEATEHASKPRKPLPKLGHGLTRSKYLKDNQGVAESNPKTTIDRRLDMSTDELTPLRPHQKAKKVNDQTSAGPEWFDMPKTTLTPQLKRDLQLIEMRSVLDPHRHYKKNNRKGKIPTFSQTGTVIEGPTEFFSARINKKERSKNFVEEAMTTEKATGRFKRKYSEIQEAKTSGKKAHYKKLMTKRKKRP
ncbi:dTDP-fucopyranose mutase [Cladophialophora chaetospira]|uniref:dTDP-fucopyranose mutase n=1 Tax=Cladophialophora chaetospira TaxID=386627 RepID=A0AA38XEY3_9EURO|nr:dTDP-fucopyranose mutase [Cladophialophora chaetospira]